jgi:hypothetical protein
MRKCVELCHNRGEAVMNGGPKPLSLARSPILLRRAVAADYGPPV